MSSVIMSTELAEVNKNLEKLGFNIIPSEKVDSLLSFEKRHADMQCLRINDTYFVLKECKKLSKLLRQLKCKVIETEKEISEKYPANVLLNAVYIDNKLYCKEKALDTYVRKYCSERNIEIINVNQGYAKCSAAVIGDGIITSDRGIFEAITRSGVEGLLIENGNISLDGVDYGFIGGCCFEHNESVYFTGDIAQHPDYISIKLFCEKRNKNIICLSKDKLYDIGGFIVI